MNPADWVVVPPPSPEALRFYHSGNLLFVVARAWLLAVPLLMLEAGWAARVRDRAEARWGGERWLLVAAATGVGLTLLGWALKLPLRFYAGFLRLHEYGLSNQTLGKWTGDALKSLGVECVLTAVVVGAAYALIRRFPRGWWAALGALVLPWSFFLLFLHPVVIAPMFNDFGPMRDKALEARILELAERCGIEGGRVYEVAKKVDTNAVNAYVSGFGGSKRIVLWDTLLERLDPDEAVFVMGHEMGHYVLNHMVLGLGLGALGALLLLGLVHLGVGRALRARGARWGVRGLEDPAGLPLILALVMALSWVGEPVGLMASRFMEGEADRFGLELTRDNRAAAGAFVELQLSNLSNPWPGPVFKLFRATHPPVGERVDFCNRYRPWAEGRPLRYGPYLGRPPRRIPARVGP